ncbi:hypothetical protein [Mycobacterium intracellulare]|uniref:hypothetical protein n=1 Tax=Mycobacterium intracellulare TaxID=1767 RepID=UPI0019293DDF|nr:hypothetical protein [Mycobacterium intracellulare]
MLTHQLIAASMPTIAITATNKPNPIQARLIMFCAISHPVSKTWWPYLRAANLAALFTVRL